MAEKRCGTCRWFDADFFGGAMTDDNDAPYGWCEWPRNRLPTAVQKAPVPIEQESTLPTDGADCPCWEKEGT